MVDDLHLMHIEPEKSVALSNLWQLYKHDLAEFRNSFPNANGRFPVKELEKCYGNSDSQTILFVSAQIPVGFAIVEGLTSNLRMIGQFFVIRSVRKKGIGLAAAARVLSMFPGSWEIAFQEENPSAARFWRRVATVVAPGTWSEEGRQDPERDFIPPDRWISLEIAAF